MNRRCMGCMSEYNSEFEVCPFCGYIYGTEAREAYHMEPGSILHDRYIVGKVIGYGGFGVTYIGWDTVLEYIVAIKEYLPIEFATRIPGNKTLTIYSGEKHNQFNIGKNRFSEEAKRLAKFNSVSGVVETKDTFIENETSYIVMEFLEGETLKDKINKHGNLHVEEAKAITKSILETLKQVHKGEIIHRDIAPDNIFCCSDGTIKLLDFGASRYATVQHSKSLSVILKEGYAPEEQYRSKGNQGPWSDIYAVGATLYKMLTGITPEDAMERSENDKLKPIGKFGLNLTKAEENAIMNALNVFAEDRTQSAEEFLNELTAENVKRKERTRKKIDIGKWPLWSKILVGCIFVVIIASGIILSQNTTFALEDGKAYVPEVINLKDTKAERKIEGNDLTIKIKGQDKSEKVEKGKVMSQYPDSGRVVNVGELVEVRISAGNTVPMVDVIGKEKAEVKKILEKLGFKNIVFEKKESAAEEGTAIEQSVIPGEEVDVNDKIIITISDGLGEIDSDEITSVPKLTGMLYENAVDKAAANKLYVEISKQVSSSKPAGTVLEQSLSQGEKVNEGTVIYLTISIGEEKVEVPYVLYLSENEAKYTLDAYNLNYSVTYKTSNTVDAGLVISQDPGSGDRVKTGTNIKLVVSKGREKVTVPSVTGLTESSAIDAIVNSDLRYTIAYKHSDSVGWGKVISSYPTGKQEKGTKITLEVSCGTSGKLVSESTYNESYTNTSRYSATRQYRYSTRSKTYTTSTSPSLSGWTQYNQTSSSTTSGYYFGNYPSTTDSNGKRVEAVSKGYYYYAYGASAPSDTSDWSYYLDRSRNGVINWMKQNFSQSKCWAEDRLRYFWAIDTSKYDYLPKNRTVNYCDDSYTSPPTTSSSGSYYMDLKLYYYSPCYKLKTTTTTYHFYKWSEWSPWGDWTSPRQSADGVSKKEDPTVMYYVVGKSPN